DSLGCIPPGQYGGCLGGRDDPFVLNANPAAANFKVRDFQTPADLTGVRLRGRRDLLTRLDRRPAPSVDFETNKAKAFDLVGNRAAQEAFDLSKEPDRVRDRYGRHSWGQSHLLARRLVEAGGRFVSTVNGASIIWG